MEVTVEQDAKALEAGAPEGPSRAPNDQTIEQLDIFEAPKIRTKLRITAIILALNVLKDLPLLLNALLANKYQPALACPLRRSTRPDYCRDFNPHNIGGSALRRRLYLDWRCIPVSQCCHSAHVGQV